MNDDFGGVDKFEPFSTGFITFRAFVEPGFWKGKRDFR